MDQEFRKGLEKIALRNKSRIYTPSGANCRF
jgi:predicted dinucleotide-utilizing enzyme